MKLVAVVGFGAAIPISQSHPPIACLVALTTLGVSLSMWARTPRHSVWFVPLGTALIVLLGLMSTPFLMQTRWFSPWEHCGRFATRDVDGDAVTVDISKKQPMMYAIPPGPRPIISLVAHSPRGDSSLTYDSGWRFGLSWINPVPGGLDLFSHRWGTRFRLDKLQWIVAGSVELACSLWESRINGAIGLGMTKPEIEAVLHKLVVSGLQAQVGSGPWLTSQGTYTKYELDEECWLFVRYGPDGRSDDIEYFWTGRRK